jgi:hypothetical protein
MENIGQIPGCISRGEPIKLTSLLQPFQGDEDKVMKSSKPFVTIMLIMVLLVPLIASCSTQSSPVTDTSGEESPVQSTGDEPDQESGPEDIDNVDLTGDESDSGSEPEDIGNVYMSCPEEPVTFKLLLNHTFNFSPGRDTEKMLITGNTSPDVWCFVLLNGNVIEADDCVVDYEFSGFIQGSDAKCDIQGASTALIEIEGECMALEPSDDENAPVAEIYLTITEGQNPDADPGSVITCPGYSNIFHSFYPTSFSVTSFNIQDQGSTDKDNGVDFSKQFEFSKSWTLIPVGGPFGP